MSSCFSAVDASSFRIASSGSHRPSGAGSSSGAGLGQHFARTTAKAAISYQLMIAHSRIPSETRLLPEGSRLARTTSVFIVAAPFRGSVS